MRGRCYSKTHQKYPHYGERGITVCERWLGTENSCGFCAFVIDMGIPPTEKHTLDRIDVNGNYEPSNVRWATYSQQNVNKRVKSNNLSGCVGVYKVKNSWQATIGVNGKHIRLGCFLDLEKAIKLRKDAEMKYYGYLFTY